MQGKLEVKKYIGIPFRYNGRTMDGVDCLGLVLLILREQGIMLPDGDGQEITPRWYETDPERLIRGLDHYGTRVDVTQLRAGDVVVFSFHGNPRHVGVMIDRTRFIHIREHQTVTVARLKKYNRYYYAAYRMAGEKR